ncbi:hypothetical protein LR48_Vigan07g171100 [Vigna angularis]|uniref:Uncharacterized protein n=1 Tax=Phaseolus angularis TaxID=3914 RepID=A0A0L9UZK7_PHAAN|nr:hypothetical protein LR48_Vigan07g171100 [Vigna angularis]
MQEAIRTRSKKTTEPLFEGLDESRRRRRIRTSRELFPSPETLLQTSPQGSVHSTRSMENNNARRTLADYIIKCYIRILDFIYGFWLYVIQFFLVVHLEAPSGSPPPRRHLRLPPPVPPLPEGEVCTTGTTRGGRVTTGVAMGTEERRGKECEGHAHIAFVAPVGLRFWLCRRRHRRCFPLQMIVNLTGRHPPRLHEPAPPPEMLTLFTPPLCQQKMEGTDDAQRKGNQTKEEKFGGSLTCPRISILGEEKREIRGKRTAEIENE